MKKTIEKFVLVHPLDDVTEAKRSTEGLGPIHMTTAVKVSLGLLRIYLGLASAILLYHVLRLAGIVGPHQP